MIPLDARRDRGALPGQPRARRPGAAVATGVADRLPAGRAGRPLRRCRRRRRTSSATRSARGAAAALVPDDAFAALAALGRAVRDRSEATVVGDHRLDGEDVDKGHPRRASARPRRRTIAAEASYNNELGVPLTLCRLEPDTEVVHPRARHARPRTDRGARGIARPSIGVVTNVGPAHLERVGSLAAVAEAKGELVAALPPGGVAIVPDDFPSGERRPRGRAARTA